MRANGTIMPNFLLHTCLRTQKTFHYRTPVHFSRASLLPRRSSPRRDDPDIEYCPHCYNAGGRERTRARGEALTDPAILEMYGGGEFPLLYTEFAQNGNYLEPQEISVRHGVCGDPEQVRWGVPWLSHDLVLIAS